jgi:hypothetical protein
MSLYINRLENVLVDLCVSKNGELAHFLGEVFGDKEPTRIANYEGQIERHQTSCSVGVPRG